MIVVGVRTALEEYADLKCASKRVDVVIDHTNAAAEFAGEKGVCNAVCTKSNMLIEVSLWYNANSWIDKDK